LSHTRELEKEVDPAPIQATLEVAEKEVEDPRVYPKSAASVVLTREAEAPQTEASAVLYHGGERWRLEYLESAEDLPRKVVLP